MMNKTLTLLAATAMAGLAAAEEKVYLGDLSFEHVVQGWGTPERNRSVDRAPMKIGDKSYAHGIGTHALMNSVYALGKKGIRFESDVGIDAEVLAGENGQAAVVFRVWGDDTLLFDSGVMRAKDAAKHVSVDLKGFERIELEVDDCGDDHYDHADWAEALVVMEDGAKPVPCKDPVEQLGILTPKAGPEPKIVGAKIYGVRPGHDILWRLPVTGERPMALSAKGLPAGAAFDEKTGILSGKVAERGEHVITFTAKNAKGSATSAFRLVVGDKIALTPPMGWNSWNCFAHAVTAQNIKDTADQFIKAGLADHGWAYVNIDDFWQNRPGEKNDRTLMGPERTTDGEIAVNARFKEMKPIADYVHAKGLKIGLYSSPGPLTCGGCTGSWGHEWQDAATYAKWGYDYLKYDWCSYNNIVVGERHARNTLCYRLMGEALAAQGRDIVFSLCQYGMGDVSNWGANVGGQCWRTTGDITDTWASMNAILKMQADLWPYAGPGAWNDPDMLIVGKVGWGSLHPTRLTPNEQYTHMSLWAILCSPLLIGCDLTALDEFTLSLLTNDEVIETNQDPLGAQAARVAKGPRGEIWAKPMSDGSIVLALVNDYGRASPTLMTADFEALGLEGGWKVRDLWRQQDLGIFSKAYSCEVLGHATQLVRLFPQPGAGLRKGLTDVRMNSVYYQFAEKRPVDRPGYLPPKGPPCAKCDRLKKK